MIQLTNAHLMRHTKVVLNHVSFTLYTTDVVGVVGVNGCGKTSFLKLLMGELALDDGHLNILSGLKMAHLQQEIYSKDLPLPALQYVIAADTEYMALKEKIQLEEDGIQLAEYHMQLESLGGYEVESKASKILHGLGFSDAALLQSVQSFSGGWQMRLNLARLLMMRADILLLDEPTNHLDLEAIVWLERWLLQSTQMIVLVSHDRQFLNKIVSKILYLQQGQATLYTGNYDQFETERFAQMQLLQAAERKQQAKKAHLQAFVDRFRYKASKAKQAQSRLKMLEKMSTIQLLQEDTGFQFQFKPVEDKVGHALLSVNDVSVGYDEIPILSHIKHSISKGDRIGLIGPNGAGKSTFIKLLAGIQAPILGVMTLAKNVKVGYFAQHQLEQLNSKATPAQSLREINEGLSELKVRQYLGGFGFSGEDVWREIGTFSGGEKARLVLALMIYQGPNLLLLDEPTNHLDLQMRDALNLALQLFEGAVLIISHDRHLLGSVVDTFWLIANGSVTLYEGDLEDYQKHVQLGSELNFDIVESPKNAANASSAAVEKKKSSYMESKLLRKQKMMLKKLEKQLAEVEGSILALDQLLGSSDFYLNHTLEEAQSKLDDRQALIFKMDEIESQLLALYIED